MLIELMDWYILLDKVICNVKYLSNLTEDSMIQLKF